MRSSHHGTRYGWAICMVTIMAIFIATMITPNDGHIIASSAPSDRHWCDAIAEHGTSCAPSVI
jgi:hypothetical protein